MCPTVGMYILIFIRTISDLEVFVLKDCTTMISVFSRSKLSLLTCVAKVMIIGILWTGLMDLNCGLRF